MGLDDRAENKRKDIFELVKSVVVSNLAQNVQEDACFDIEKISSRITDNFAKITPPEPEPFVFHQITLSSGGISGGSSRKPGNILLNWKKLCIAGSESVLTIVGAASIPWLIPLAALVVWDKLWSLQKIQITERDAAVIWTMWKNRDSRNCIEAENILDLVNMELLSYNRPVMVENELELITRNLEKMECIEKIKENNWWLREWVKVTYE